MLEKECFSILNSENNSIENRTLTVLIDDYDRKYKESYDYYIYTYYILLFIGFSLSVLPFFTTSILSLPFSMSGFLFLVAAYAIANAYKQHTIMPSVLYIDEQRLLISNHSEASKKLNSIWVSHPDINKGELTAYTKNDVTNLKLSTVTNSKLDYDVLVFTLKNLEKPVKFHFKQDMYVKELNLLRTYISND